MVKNKLLYATIAAMLMGAVFTGCSNTHNNNTTTESLKFQKVQVMEPV